MLYDQIGNVSDHVNILNDLFYNFRQVSVLSERVRNISEAVSTPPGTPNLSSREAATPGTPNLNRNAAAAGSKTNIATHKPGHEVPNGVGKKTEKNKEEEKKLIEAEKMETERVRDTVMLFVKILLI